MAKCDSNVFAVLTIKVKWIITVFLSLSVFTFHCLFAQNQGQSITDSLIKVLAASKEDTAKVSLLNSISSKLRYDNTDTAYYFAEQALTLATKLKFDLGIADSKIRLGMQCALLGRYNEGIKNTLEAIVIYEKLLAGASALEKDKYMAKIGNSYNVAGHNTISQGNYPEGLKYTFLSLKINEKRGNKKGVSFNEYNLGNIYYNQKNFSEALKHYERSLKLSEELGDKADIAGTIGTIGDVYIEMGKYDEALPNLTKALWLSMETGDAYTIGMSNSTLGLLENRMGKYDSSMYHHKEALKILEELGNNEFLPFQYNYIADVYMNQKQYSNAAMFINKALKISKKSGTLAGLKLTYENLTKLDSAQGKFENSLKHYKLAIAYRDSLFNEENTKQTIQQQMQYDFDKKESLTKAEQEKKDAVALKELQKQKIVRNGFIGGFTVVLLFAGVFFTQRNKIRKGKKLSDNLLLNILPSEVAEELKAKGRADARQYNDVTVMFTDFKNFTQISEQLSPEELVAEIHTCFKEFDMIIEKHNIEKIKTIGDSYMCAGGLPVVNKTNATDVIEAAIEIQRFMEDHLRQRTADGKERFEIRIGVHSGPVVAGIVGVKKFAYDIWGDTVNIASRMESSGEPGKVNISGNTFQLIKHTFNCSYRGKIEAKNKGEIDMYFVNGSIALG